MSHHKHFTKVW